MKQYRLGKTELMVSELGFGGIPIIPLSMEEGAAVVRHCYRRGITFFDTANAYSDSEKKVGLALEDVRDRVVIATKTGRRDAEGAARHLQFSLDNLRTDYIDIYQFHNISDQQALDTILAPGGAMEPVKAAQREGRINLSASAHTTSPRRSRHVVPAFFLRYSFPSISLRLSRPMNFSSWPGTWIWASLP